nr:hypothetical protein [Tanacetum cinerariifolium]
EVATVVVEFSKGGVVVAVLMRWLRRWGAMAADEECGGDFTVVVAAVEKWCGNGDGDDVGLTGWR